jgi:FkbM family methyltransferase
MLGHVRTWIGVARSLRTYYGDRPRHRAMDALYLQFVKPGDLVFDIGSHVGDRIASFRRLGARVVAVEPQPALVATLRLLHGRDRSVALEPVAIGRSEGTLDLRLNSANPTISTASDAFVAATAGARGWEGQVWDRTVTVPVTTFDTLISRHGRPAFAKIDVEGFEAEVLHGLSAPVPALSFEFTTIQRDVALAAVDRLSALGDYCFDAALGESQTLQFTAAPLDADAIKAWLVALPHAANSGDVYARLTGPVVV